MVGYYNKAEKEAPVLVQAVDRLMAHRNALIIGALAVLLGLAILSIFLPKVGLILLGVALIAFVGLFIFIRASARHQTHWQRGGTHRR